MSTEEQRAYVKIECLRGSRPSQIHENLQEACGDTALSRSRVFEWARRFSEGRTSIDDDPRSGRPVSKTDENHVEQVRKLISEDARITCDSVAEHVDISHATAHHIITSILGLRKLAAKFVPHLLTEEQKRNRVITCAAHIRRYRREGQVFLNRIVAVDETWARCYEPELKRQSAQWCGPGDSRPTKMRQGGSRLKQMVILAYSSKKVLLVDFVPSGCSVNKDYYKNFLSRLRRAIRDKQPELHAAGPILLQDNASCHKAEIVMNLLDQFGWEPLPHPPYSPDLSPCDFDAFPKIKEPLRGSRFSTLEELKKAWTDCVKTLVANGGLIGIMKLPDRWTASIELEGNYIEG